MQTLLHKCLLWRTEESSLCQSYRNDNGEGYKGQGVMSSLNFFLNYMCFNFF